MMHDGETREDLLESLAVGISYYGCRFIEDLKTGFRTLPDFVTTSAMRFYHFATAKEDMMHTNHLHAIASASFAVAYSNYLEQENTLKKMRHSNQLRKCNENNVYVIVDAWKDVYDKLSRPNAFAKKICSSSHDDLVPQLINLGDAIIQKVNTNNIYIQDGRKKVDKYISADPHQKVRLFVNPLPADVFPKVSALAQAFIRDSYYVPTCIYFDLYQSAACGIYTAMEVVGIKMPMDFSKVRLSKPRYLKDWANFLFKFYSIYPTVRNTYNNNDHERRPGWISYESTVEGGVERNGLQVWDFRAYE